jgi:hypothetical protein
VKTRARKRLRCRLGFHRWITAVSDGERFLRCRYCGKFGGRPPSPWAYTDRSYGP